MQGNFSFSTAKSELQSRDPISITEFAQEIAVPVEKIYLLVQYGYLNVLKPDKNPDLCIIGRPRPAAIVWLAQTLGPLPYVPLIPTRYAVDMLGLRKETFRRLILEHNVPIYIDPAFGEMMTIVSFHGLFNCLYPWHERVRFDRQMFFAILADIDPCDGTKFVSPMPYDQKLEEEIDRIYRLEEPTRTMRAMDIYEAFKTAHFLSEPFRLKRTDMIAALEAIMERLKRKLEITYADDDSPEPDSGVSDSDSESRSSATMSVATSNAGLSTVNPPSTAL